MERKSLTTEAVLNKAIELAKATGIDSITYNGLARELGIRPQSMYRYIPDIKTLRISLLSYFLEKLTDSIDAAMENLSPKDALKAFSVTMYDECHRNPWYYQSFELMHQYEIIEDLKVSLIRLVSLVEMQMKQLISDPMESSRLVQMFMAMNLGYAQMSMTPFIPSSLADNREMFLISISSFIADFT